jgi:hypothetical protein
MQALSNKEGEGCCSSEQPHPTTKPSAGPPQPRQTTSAAHNNQTEPPKAPRGRSVDCNQRRTSKAVGLASLNRGEELGPPTGRRGSNR